MVRKNQSKTELARYGEFFLFENKKKRFIIWVRVEKNNDIRLGEEGTTMKNIHFAVLVLAFAFILSACNDDGSKENGLALIQTTNPSPVVFERNTKHELDLIGSIEQDIEAFEEIYDVAVLKGKKEILVTYKVKHLQRFKMKKIEKRVNKLLEEKYPDENFIISSDSKIFLKAMELEKNLKDPNFSKKDAEKKLQEIIKLKKERT